MRTIYFDYNATTPLDSAVRKVMTELMAEAWGNPSSIHYVGRHARALLDEARERTARVLACKPSEVIFTSGGTESVNLAVLGTARALKSKGRHLVTSSVEHHAVIHSFEYLARHEGFELTQLPVDKEGRVDPADLRKALRTDTILVSVMAANNETGTLQPVAELGALCRERGVVFHTDAVQWFGKEPLVNVREFNADLVSICAHKIHGPKGAGALFIRSPLHPDPIFFGGGHENEHRAGTENLVAIIGFVECLERFVKEPVFARDNLSKLSNRLIAAVENIQGCHLVGSRKFCLANTVSFVAERSDSITLLAGLDMEGICASSGSACSAGSLQPSHVIKAMGWPEPLANSLIRFSLGRESTDQEIEVVASSLPEIVRRSQHGK